MALINANRKSEELSRAEAKEDVLEREIDRLSLDLGRDNDLLDLMNDPVWVRVIDNILIPRKRGLAEQRMKIPFDDDEAHKLITGQFNEVEKLSRRRNELVAEIDTCTDELARKRDELVEVRVRITKLKE